MNELNFIDYLRKHIKHDKDVICGIGDDAAVLKYTRKKHLLFTCDMLIEGVHFEKNAKPEEIGWKAIAVNISDIAAMGGVPKYVVISVGIPKNSAPSTAKRLMNGVKKICRFFDVSIVGGDTNAGPNLVIDVAIIGEVEKDFLVLRSGAKAGDLIFTTGTLGEGRIKHLSFMPRIEEARMLVRHFKINSMIDISDGLFLDLYRLAEASSVGARIYKSLIPLADVKHMKYINDGEDFELMFTLSISQAKKLMKYMGRHERPDVTLIGEVVSKKYGLNFIEEEGRVRRIRAKGYTHF